MTTSASVSTTSVSGLGLSGLSSGLDTSGIITKLMAIESAPQTLLKNQLSTLQTHTTALQSLNTAIAALATTAKSATTANALNSFTTTSSSTAASATASSTATAGSVSFTVDQLAAKQVSVTGAIPSWPDASSSTPSITIQVGSGPSATTKTVIASSTDLDDVVTAINRSGTGVSASKVAAGTDGSGHTTYRLQLTGAFGAANAFSVYEGTTTAATQLPTTSVASAQDAKITLYGGTSASQQVTSPSNRFSSLLSGVDVTVSSTSTSAVSIDVAADASAASTSARALTSGLITIFAGIASSSAITTGSSTSGGASSSSTSGSVFTGDSLVRTTKDALLAAASGAVNGKSPSSIGINLTKDGTISFDQNAFQAAMTADPAGTLSMYQTIATRVSTAASVASDAYTGTLSQSITSETSRQSDMSSRISDWDTRLATIQAQYTAQFNALETALNSLSSQATYLTSQINSLTTNYQTAS